MGIPEAEAKEIERSYHELYEVSDKWVQDRLIRASKDGFLTLAFGLRLRTPILAQTILNTSSTPYEASAESRTAGNALGQSYGLLNNRAAIEFYGRLLNSKYKYDIKPIAHIHDAQYFLLRKNHEVIKWFNDNLVECMEWQELPEIKHPQVGLGGAVELFIDNWSKHVTLPNKATTEQIEQLIKEYYIKN